jgi:hypothetical protein
MTRKKELPEDMFSQMKSAVDASFLRWQALCFLHHMTEPLLVGQLSEMYFDLLMNGIAPAQGVH